MKSTKYKSIKAYFSAIWEKIKNINFKKEQDSPDDIYRIFHLILTTSLIKKRMVSQDEVLDYMYNDQKTKNILKDMNKYGLINKRYRIDPDGEEYEVAYCLSTS